MLCTGPFPSPLSPQSFAVLVPLPCDYVLTYVPVPPHSFAVRRVMLLEFSQYLENYLWPNYNPRLATHAHLMSVVVTVNEKFRERVPAWHVSWMAGMRGSGRCLVVGG